MKHINVVLISIDYLGSSTISRYPLFATKRKHWQRMMKRQSRCWNADFGCSCGAQVVAAVLDNEEDEDGHLVCMHIIQDLMRKSADTFLDHFARLGIFSKVQLLANSNNCPSSAELSSASDLTAALPAGSIARAAQDSPGSDMEDAKVFARKMKRKLKTNDMLPRVFQCNGQFLPTQPTLPNLS